MKWELHNFLTHDSFESTGLFGWREKKTRKQKWKLEILIAIITSLKQERLNNYMDKAALSSKIRTKAS